MEDECFVEAMQVKFARGLEINDNRSGILDSLFVGVTNVGSYAAAF